MTDQEAIKQMRDLANHLHQSIPEGTDGGVVMGALAVLIGVGANYAPPERRDAVISHTLAVFERIINGELDIRFEIKN
jgi:hypothetical protein